MQFAVSVLSFFHFFSFSFFFFFPLSLPPSHLFTSCSGFWGDLETKEAQARLEGKPEGYYLIRFSLSEPLGYAITRVGAGNQIKNVKILIKNWEFCVTEKGKTYPNLEALVTEVRDTLHLTNALGGSRFEKLGLEEASGPVYEVVIDEDDEKH